MIDHQRKRRNWGLFGSLLILAVLVYAVTLVKIAQGLGQ